ncbi:MAG: hypothetical protein QOE50_1561 [Sphingomonadales bacterium]|nr:hypothetical protein [Sphingomonadales bacterium]
MVTFDDVSEGTVASNQYTGMVITGGSVLTQSSQLNSVFPPQSPPNVLYNYLNGTITVNFTTSVVSIGAFVTGNTGIVLSAFNGATLLGTSSTSGANYVGSAGTPNQFLQLLFPTITSASFFSSNGTNSFTIDNLTVGGTIINNSAVPEPATWLMMLIGFGGMGLTIRNRRRRAGLPQIA